MHDKVVAYGRWSLTRSGCYGRVDSILTCTHYDYLKRFFCEHNLSDLDWNTWHNAKSMVKMLNTIQSQHTYSSDNINDWYGAITLVLVVLPGLLTHKGPQLIQVESWPVVLVHGFVIVPHTYFSKVTWMAVVEKQKQITGLFQTQSLKLSANRWGNGFHVHREKSVVTWASLTQLQICSEQTFDTFISKLGPNKTTTQIKFQYNKTSNFMVENFNREISLSFLHLKNILCLQGKDQGLYLPYSLLETTISFTASFNT